MRPFLLSFIPIFSGGMSIPTVALPAPLSFPSWRGVDFRILGATLTFWPPKPIPRNPT